VAINSEDDGRLATIAVSRSSVSSSGRIAGRKAVSHPELRARSGMIMTGAPSVSLSVMVDACAGHLNWRWLD
jgi:hypothetical protein